MIPQPTFSPQPIKNCGDATTRSTISTKRVIDWTKWTRVMPADAQPFTHK